MYIGEPISKACNMGMIYVFKTLVLKVGILFNVQSNKIYHFAKYWKIARPNKNQSIAFPHLDYFLWLVLLTIIKKNNSRDIQKLSCLLFYCTSKGHQMEFKHSQWFRSLWLKEKVFSFESNIYDQSIA